MCLGKGLSHLWRETLHHIVFIYSLMRQIFHLYRHGNGRTNQLMNIGRLVSTCEALGYTVLGKKMFSGTSVRQCVFYLTARANHTFGQIQQGMLWHLFTVRSTARTYHPGFSNSKSLVSSTGPVPQQPQSKMILLHWTKLKHELTINLTTYVFWLCGPDGDTSIYKSHMWTPTLPTHCIRLMVFISAVIFSL